jgi:prepilin-type N-terminal cleavage/methylation domain-containing protein
MQRPRIRKEEFGIRISCGGFTVIELIMVLLIVGIVAAVVTSATFYRTDRGLDPQVAALKGHLRYAQTMAIQSDVNWGIYIRNEKKYCLFRESTAEANWVMLPGESKLEYELPNGITVDAEYEWVSFSPGWGIPSTSAWGSPATYYLTMKKGSGSATITITKNTGFVP